MGVNDLEMVVENIDSSPDIVNAVCSFVVDDADTSLEVVVDFSSFDVNINSDAEGVDVVSSFEVDCIVAILDVDGIVIFLGVDDTDVSCCADDGIFTLVEGIIGLFVEVGDVDIVSLVDSVVVITTVPNTTTDTKGALK